MNRPHEQYLTQRGFKYVGYSAPYSFFDKEGVAVGLCFSCGLVITGDKILNLSSNAISLTNLRKHRWVRRSIKELETFINERVATE